MVRKKRPVWESRSLTLVHMLLMIVFAFSMALGMAPSAIGEFKINRSSDVLVMRPGSTLLKTDRTFGV